MLKKRRGSGDHRLAQKARHTLALTATQQTWAYSWPPGAHMLTYDHTTHANKLTTP